MNPANKTGDTKRNEQMNGRKITLRQYAKIIKFMIEMIFIHTATNIDAASQQYILNK